MARIRKQLLSWKLSESNLVVGYKLYWSNETPVSYDSNFIKLGNITEVNLPDILFGVAPSGKSIYLGISTVDEMGSESDIISLPEPCHFLGPPAPMDLFLTTLDDFKIIETKIKIEDQVHDSQKLAIQQINQEFLSENPHSPSKNLIMKRGIDNDYFNRIRKALLD